MYSCFYIELVDVSKNVYLVMIIINKEVECIIMVLLFENHILKFKDYNESSA